MENTPFTVGVAGHRDLDATEVIRLIEACRTFLLDLRSRLPDTELRLMLEPPSSAVPAMAQMALSLDLPVDLLIGSGAAEPELPRGLQVSRIAVPDGAAEVMLRRCSLLLALWDGSPAVARDDAAHRVFRFLGVHAEPGEALRPLQIAAAPAELDMGVRLVYWIPAARGGAESDVPGEPGFLIAAGDSFLDVHRSMPPSLAGRLDDLNAFNAEYTRYGGDGTLVPSESLMSGLTPDLLGSDADLLENIDRQYVKADSLAGHMQTRSDRLFSAFGVMTFTMGLAYLVYDKITESRMLLGVYVFILFSSLLVYYLLQGRRWFGKHLAYRALAETLRVRFYLALAGVDGRLRNENLITMTGIDKFRGFSWISFVLHAVEPTAPHAAPRGDAYAQRCRLVDEAWVDSQYRYYSRKVKLMEKESRRVSRLKTVMFGAILVDVSAMFIFGEALNHVDAHFGLPIKNVVTFCSGFLAVILGVWELRHNKMATRELLWQYRSQLGQFERASVQLKRNPARGRREDLLVQLGSNSLMEIYLWAIHRYHREHSPPTAAA